MTSCIDKLSALFLIQLCLEGYNLDLVRVKLWILLTFDSFICKLVYKETFICFRYNVRMSLTASRNWFWNNVCFVCIGNSFPSVLLRSHKYQIQHFLELSSSRVIADQTLFRRFFLIHVVQLNFLSDTFVITTLVFITNLCEKNGYIIL